MPQKNYIGTPFSHGVIAQLVERLNGIQKVGSSSLPGSTMRNNFQPRPARRGFFLAETALFIFPTDESAAGGAPLPDSVRFLCLRSHHPRIGQLLGLFEDQRGAQIAAELDVSYPSLKDWKRRSVGDATPVRADLAAENRALKAELVRVREQRDIKKMGHPLRTAENGDFKTLAGRGGICPVLWNANKFH